jgi:hypothetical protein
MRGQWGVGGGRYSTKLAGERTSADIPRPNLVSRFRALFLKAREARSKKKKEEDSKTTILVLDKNKG